MSCGSGGMRSGISFTLSALDRLQLEALVAGRNTPQKHVWRARIVLLSADGLGTHAIMREAGVSKTAVWRWQERFAQESIDGLRRDKTRPARIAPLGPKVAARVVALTQTDPPGETTHWTAAAMAKAASISISSVQRIWRGHGLQPHRVRQFQLSNAPAFATKLREVATSNPFDGMPWSSASTSTRLPMPSCSASMRRARSRRSP